MSDHMATLYDFPARFAPVPSDTEPREREPRIADEGEWFPVSNRFLSYGTFMFALGFLTHWVWPL